MRDTQIMGGRGLCLGLTLVFLLLFLFAATAAGGDAPYVNQNPTVVMETTLAPGVAGSTFSDTESDNSFSVNGDVRGSVYGGIAVDNNEASTGNSVTITGNPTIGSSITGSGVVVGGWSRNGAVEQNKVSISGGIVRGMVFGGEINENIGYGIGGNATGNEVILSGNTEMRGNIYGAYSGGISTITGNTVTIGGTVDATFAGGIIAGGYDSIYGADGKLASGNKVIIKDNAIIEGTARSHMSIYGGRMHTGNASGNTVEVSGGRIANVDIYGGQNNNISDGYISSNAVTVTGGAFNAVTIYGGSAGRAGNATFNVVDIGGANTTFTGVDVYGGRSNGGVATNNKITIDSTATGAVAIGNLYGGIYGGSGASRGDVFSGNELIKNSAATTINTVRNVNTVQFGYASDGVANIGTLDTTPTGSSRSGVIVDTSGAGDVTFGGVINGSGTLTKTGVSDLILTGDDNRIINSAGVTVQEGRLQIGSGGTNGSLFTSRYTVDTAGTLAYNHSNTVTYGGLISGTGTLEQAGAGTLILTGDGSSIGDIKIDSGTLQLGDGGSAGSIAAGNYVFTNDAILAYNQNDAVMVKNDDTGKSISGDGTIIQRGTGSLTIDYERRNNFTGGTEIESGTLNILDSNSLNWANGAAILDDWDTNTGASSGNQGYISFTKSSDDKRVAILPNPNGNTPSLSHSFRTRAEAVSGNVVDFTAVPEAWLHYVNILDNGGAFYVAQDTEMSVVASRLLLEHNTAAGVLNDLHVESGGIFNLRTEAATIFKSGITGTGTLNLSASAPYATVQLLNDDSGTHTFQMGTTNLTGTAANPIALNLARSNLTGERVTFSHKDTFKSENAAIIGDGIIQADKGITLKDTELIPYASDLFSNPLENELAPGIFTLKSQNITLDNFTLGYLVGGNQEKLPGNIDATNITQSSKTSLLYFDTDSPIEITGNIIVDIQRSLQNAQVDTTEDYLIMRSGTDGAFAGMSESEMRGKLTAYVNGREIGPTSDTVRGGITFKFGGDPDTAGNFTLVGSGDYKNVWLTHELNSLTMDWTGGNQTAPVGNTWAGDNNAFLSLQAEGGEHEYNFMGGDEVYISGDGEFTVTLPGSSASDPILGDGMTVVSGLVVGQKSNGVTTSGGVYTIDGNGGITAFAGSAFGKYVDPAYTGADRLDATGKLQKVGDSTLVFKNTGMNLFHGGIELSGGTTQFNSGDQLVAPQIDFTSSESSTKAVLDATEDVALYTSIEIDAGFTGVLSAASGKNFTYEGEMTGGTASILEKAGKGTLILTHDGNSVGDVNVTSGTLQIGKGGTSGNLATPQYNVASGATLAYNRSNEVEYAGLIDGDGTLEQKGKGTLILTGDNNRIGDAKVTSGRLQIGNGETSGSLDTPQYNVASGATLAYNRNDSVNLIHDRLINGAGTLEQVGGTAKKGTLILTGDDNSIGDVKVTGGTLQIGVGGTEGEISTSLYTVASGATLAYNRSDEVEYAGLIDGDGTLEQKGTGTLILTGDDSSIGDVKITSGTLQLGDGGTSGSGSIEVANDVNIAETAVLAYKHKDDIEDKNHITGEGTVVQRGNGTLTLSNAAGNDFTGGTEIESGTLAIVDDHSLNRAQSVIPGSKQGFVTFTGSDANGPKKIEIGTQLLLTNSFRTEAGHKNYVSASAPIAIMGVSTADDGGAFHVADGTTMNVDASVLELAFNRANGSGRDLYVGAAGKFNLSTGVRTTFESGIAGDGTLTLRGGLGTADASVPFAQVVLLDDVDSEDPLLDITPTYDMGTTKVEGLAGYTPISLDLLRGNNVLPRVTFTNESFEVIGDNGAYTAALRGDGIVSASTGIHIHDGGVLFPFEASDSTPGTLTLKSNKIVLDGFGLVYGVNSEVDVTQKLLGSDSAGILTSNNSLLYLDSGTTEKAYLDDGLISVVTVGGGGSFEEGHYLVVASTNGFETTENGVTVNLNNSNINDHLKLRMGSGIIVPKGSATGPRGTFDGFYVGNAPSKDGNTTIDLDGTNPITDIRDDDGKNIWLSHELNSLSMELNSDAITGEEISWNLPDFESLQADGLDHEHEHKFWDSDKVYVTGNDVININLPAADARDLALGATIITSGLVVGQGISDPNNVDYTGKYAFTGDGSISAYKQGAFGKYVNSNSPEEKLVPTGKLEKYGDSTLLFENKGDNYFENGIELYGGKTQFNRKEQLGVGDEAAIAFKPYLASSKAVLEATEDVELDTNTRIDDNFTGVLSADSGKKFTYAGEMTGGTEAILGKSGAGVVELAGNSSAATMQGKIDVQEGELYVTGNYGATTGFSVLNSATLSGVGTLGGNGVIQEDGWLKPGGLKWSGSAKPVEHALTITAGGANGDLNFNAGSGFAVRLAEYYDDGANRYSDRVDVAGAVTIDSKATLAVQVDYFKWKWDPEHPAYYTIITADSPQKSGETTFTLDTTASNLPRGVTIIEHGWELDDTDTDHYQYQIGEIHRTGPGYGGIPDGPHNENEIGKTIDHLVDDHDPGIEKVVDRLTGDDDHIRKQLDHLTGDLTPNALFMALKEPWRHPFRRLDLDARFEDDDRPENIPPAVVGGFRPRVWAEYTARYETTRSDGNAHDFRIRRNGLAIGMDHRFSPNLIAGANFQYTNPRLYQSTGRVEADDYEFGVYGDLRLFAGIDAKLYAGYSHQRYDFKRTVFLSAPPPPNSAAGSLYERMNGHTSGNALAASLELMRPVEIHPAVRLLPTFALDFEKAWMNGYRESGGPATALVYDDSSFERTMLRFGMGSEFSLPNKLALKTRVQYATQLNREKYPSTGVRFAAATKPNQRTADIWGNRIGRDYINLGAGGEWKFGPRDNATLYVNYDVKFYRRATVHAGEAGVSFAF